MLAQSTSWNLRMASITAKGFCAVAALSRYTRGFPWILCFRTGKSSRTLSTSKPAEITLVSALMEFLEQDSFQRIFQGLNFDAIDDVLREGVGQQAARILFADAARPQVEHGFGIQLADGGAVRAAHVVGENLQFGLGIDHRLVGQHQVLVGLLGVGLLRVLADDDAA